MSPLVPSRTFEDRLRRLLDALVSGVGLLLLSPLLLGAALAVRLSSPGPVLFRQERVGLGGRPFEILKFRTMRVDADRDGLQLTVGDDPSPRRKRAQRCRKRSVNTSAGISSSTV